MCIALVKNSGTVQSVTGSTGSFSIFYVLHVYVMKGMQLTLSVVKPNNFDLFVEKQASVAQIFERLVIKLRNFLLEIGISDSNRNFE